MSPFRTVAIAGGGTMGADIALTFARAGRAVHVTDPSAAVREALASRLSALPGLAPVTTHEESASVSWDAVDLWIEAAPERLDLKRRLFAEAESRARPDAILASNSSGFPISAIAEGLARPSRCFNLHYFMPAHLVPLVEVVCGAASDPALAESLVALMRDTGKVPVLVRRDLPGFLANRLQHALSREAFSMVDAGIATPEDIDAAVRFGFGFRYLAAGPALQRDHAGLDVHAAAAATMYPTLCNDAAPARALADRVAAGRLGMKAGAGFRDWPPAAIAAEKARYEALLEAALALVAAELPPVKAP